MIKTDINSVLNFLDQEILSEIASEFLLGTKEKQIKFPLKDQVKEYFFEEAEKKFGFFQANKLEAEIDWDEVIAKLIEEEQEVIDNKMVKDFEEEKAWSEGKFYVDQETGSVEERF